MPRLDNRLKAVATLIRSRIHADVGSDHGHLLKALLTSGRIDFGIAIENKQQPLQNSITTLADFDAEVRFADGLSGLGEGEADSLSICGLGGQSMVRMLSAFPNRVPKTVIIQPNRRADLVRRWGLESSYELVGETVSQGRRNYTILQFQFSSSDIDPAYAGLDLKAALLFGPHLIRRRDPTLMRRLDQERKYLKSMKRLGSASSERLAAINGIL